MSTRCLICGQLGVMFAVCRFCGSLNPKPAHPLHPEPETTRAAEGDPGSPAHHERTHPNEVEGHGPPDDFDLGPGG